MPTSEILREVAEQKVRCPLLGPDDLCVLYEHRPITCRLYGIPTAIGEEAHTCHRSGFEPGQPYPTVQMAKLQDQLYVISHELGRGVGSRFTEVGDMLVPPSMALMSEYDESYLNVPIDDGEAGEQSAPSGSGPAQATCTSCSQDQATCGQDASSCSSCSPDSSIVIGRADGEEDEALNEHQPSPEQVAAWKQDMYDKLSKRQRKWVDRVGFENWDPFQKPSDPIDIRTDVTGAHPAAVGAPVPGLQGRQMACGLHRERDPVLRGDGGQRRTDPARV